MDYYLYKLQSFVLRSLVKKMIKKREIAPDTWQRHFIKIADSVTSGMAQVSAILAENEWFNKPVCFLPQSPDLVTQLINTNFEGQVRALRTPNGTFSIAIPKEIRFNGQRIEGLFIDHGNDNTDLLHVVKFNKKFSTDITTPHFSKDFDGKNYTITFNPKKKVPSHLRIFFRNPADNAFTGITFNNLTDIKLLYETSSLEDFVKTCPADKTLKDTIPMDKTRYEILKFVVSFIIYMSAHEEAIEQIDSIKMRGSMKGSKPTKIYNVPHFKPKGTVCAHYRNLRDERYYKGEWEDWEPGTRWVPVNMETYAVNKV